MPPKRKDDKKEEEVVDLSTLPPWTTFFISIHWHPYLQHLHQIFNFSPFTSVTREEIETFAREKGIFQPETPDATITPSQLAKAFKEKVFSLDVAGRKAKKETLQKKEEVEKLLKEAVDKGLPPPEIAPIEIDTSKPDRYYLVMNYPRTLEEAQELAKEGHTLHLFYVLRPSEKEQAKKYKQLCEEYSIALKDFQARPVEANPKQPTETMKMPIEPVMPIHLPELYKILNDARVNSEKQSQIRALKLQVIEWQEDVIKEKAAESEAGKSAEELKKDEKQGALLKRQITKEVDSKDRRPIPARREDRKKEEAKKREEKKEEKPEEEAKLDINQVFCQNLLESILKAGSDFINYNTWLTTVKPVPLFPIKKDPNASLEEEDKVELTPISSPPLPTVQAVSQASLTTSFTKDQPKGSKYQRSEVSVLQPVVEVVVEKPPPPPVIKSQDDLEKNWDFSYYYKLVNSVEDSVVNSEFILACMMQQLVRDGSVQEEIDQEEAQELARYFENKWENIVQTDVPSEEIPQTAGKLNRFQFGLDDNQLIVDDQDEVAKKLQNSLFPETSKQIRHEAMKIINQLVVPGIRRHLMPEIPEKSESLRGSERTEIYPFSSLPIPELERALMLFTLENAMKSVQPEREWSFGDRKYEEKLTTPVLVQTLSKALLFDPDVLAHYYARTDSLLLALFFKTPPGRILRRQWTSGWRVIPNFSQFLTYFKNSFPHGNEFYDVDEEKVGLIRERTKLMFPADNSVIKSVEYSIGPKLPDEKFLEKDYSIRHRTLVYKDAHLFGIRKGKLQNTGELWAYFKDGVRSLFELENDGAAITLQQKNGLTIKILPKGEIMQSLTQQLTQERAKAIYSHLNRDIKKEVPEISRIVTGKGTVIKFLQDDTVQLLMANGNVAVRSKDRVWVTTNSKGMRRARRERDGLEYELDSIPSATVTDPETLAKTMIREDLVRVIRYADGSRVTEHADGTKMFTAADGNTILVENFGFAPVKIIFDPKKARQNTVIGLGSAESGLGAEDLMLRSNDGRICEVYLPDNSVVYSFLQKQELEGYNSFLTSRVNLIHKQDGTVIKATQNGEVVIITGETRAELSDRSSEHSYFYELFTVPEDRSSGVYTIDLNAGKLWTRDQEGNHFEIRADGKSCSKLAVSLSIEEGEPVSPRMKDGELIEEECKFLPPPSSILPPRLFLIDNQGEGSEFMNEEQLASLFRNSKPEFYYKEEKEEISHTWILPVKKTLLEMGFLPESPLINYTIPKVVEAVQQTYQIPQEPKPTVYIYKNVLEHNEFTHTKRETFLQEMQRYEEWKNTLKTQRREFGVEDLRTEAQKMKEFEIQERILNMRKDRNLLKQEPNEEYKNKVLSSANLKSTPAFESDTETESQNFKRSSREAERPVHQPSRALDYKAPATPISISDQSDLNRNIVFTSQHIRGFYNYFESMEGLAFLAENPPTTPPIKSQPKPLEEVDPYTIPPEQSSAYEAMRGSFSNTQKASAESFEVPNEEKSDNPLIVLEAESREKQKILGRKVQLKPIDRPSCFAEVEQLQKMREEAEMMAAQEYLGRKTKNFDVYGIPRSEKPKVTSLKSSSPLVIPNEKFILSESVTDRRVKTVSMANRAHMKAPSVSNIRRDGAHSILSKALWKKQSYEQMMETQNMMISAFTSDPLKKSLMVIPAAIRFGVLPVGETFEMNLFIKNEDVQLMRFNIRQPPRKDIRIIYKPAPLAPGMTSKVTVELTTKSIEQLETEFQIAAKAEIYKLPVFANIVSSEEYQRIDEESVRLHGRGVQKPGVKAKGGQILNTGVSEIWGETTMSDAKLPRLPQGKTEIRVDPERSLKDMLRERGRE
jgi:hypothetical protein